MWGALSHFLLISILIKGHFSAPIPAPDGYVYFEDYGDEYVEEQIDGEHLFHVLKNVEQDVETRNSSLSETVSLLERAEEEWTELDEWAQQQKKVQTYIMHFIPTASSTSSTTTSTPSSTISTTPKTSSPSKTIDEWSAWEKWLLQQITAETTTTPASNVSTMSTTLGTTPSTTLSTTPSATSSFLDLEHDYNLHVHYDTRSVTSSAVETTHPPSPSTEPLPQPVLIAAFTEQIAKEKKVFPCVQMYCMDKIVRIAYVCHYGEKED